MYHLEPIDFGRRMASEKELLADSQAPQANAIFDESGNFIIYATLLGIKVSATSEPVVSCVYCWMLHKQACICLGCASSVYAVSALYSHAGQAHAYHTPKAVAALAVLHCLATATAKSW